MQNSSLERIHYQGPGQLKSKSRAIAFSWSCRGLEKQTFNYLTGSRRKSLWALKGTCPKSPPILQGCQAQEHVIQWWQNMPVQCRSGVQRAGVKQGGSTAFFNTSNIGEPGDLRSKQHLSRYLSPFSAWEWPFQHEEQLHLIRQAHSLKCLGSAADHRVYSAPSLQLHRAPKLRWQVPSKTKTANETVICQPLLRALSHSDEAFSI